MLVTTWFVMWRVTLYRRRHKTPVAQPEIIELKQNQRLDPIFSIRNQEYEEISHFNHDDMHDGYIHPSDLLDANMHVFDPYQRLDERAMMSKYV